MTHFEKNLILPTSADVSLDAEIEIIEKLSNVTFRVFFIVGSTRCDKKLRKIDRGKNY